MATGTYEWNSYACKEKLELNHYKCTLNTWPFFNSTQLLTTTGRDTSQIDFLPNKIIAVETLAFSLEMCFF